MKVLIVGGAGLIGSALSALVSEAGHDVLILDNFTSNSVEHRELVCREVCTGNAGSFSTVNRVFASFKPDAVFHFADSSYDKESVYDMCQESDVAVSVANKVLKCIEQYKTKFVFFGSSGEVYKGGTKRKVSETSKMGHFSYTGATKLYLENMFYLASKQYGFVFTSLRFFQVFGPRKFFNSKHDVVTFFIDCILRDEGVVIVGPDTYIDLLNFTDAAVASYLVFKTVTEGTLLNSVNIGSGEAIKLYDLYCSLVDKIEGGKNGSFKTSPRRQTRSLVANTEKLKSLGWELSISIDDALVLEAARRERIFNA